MKATRTANTRKMKPKASVQVAAACVSQLTCLALFGMDERRYREFIHRERVSHTTVGKLLIADVETVRAKLAEIARDETPAGDHEALANDDDAPESADDVLARLGKRRVAGARG